MPLTTKDPNRYVVFVASGSAIVFVLALGAMIVRELVPHQPQLASNVSHPSEPILAPTASAEPPPPLPAVGAIAHALPVAAPEAPAAPSAAPSAPAPRPALPEAASALSGILADPRSAPVANVTHDARGRTETFAYERLPPFTAAQLTRDKKNHEAWQIGGLSDLPIEDLGPRGALREAAVQKDDNGEVAATWYAIESGPLAPSYASKVGPQTRIVSKAYLEANRADFPASITSVLDR